MAACLLKALEGESLNVSCLTPKNQFQWTATNEASAETLVLLHCPEECNDVVKDGFSADLVQVGKVFNSTLHLLNTSRLLNHVTILQCQDGGGVNISAVPCSNILIESEATSQGDPMIYVVIGVVATFLVLTVLLLAKYMTKKDTCHRLKTVEMSKYIVDTEKTCVLPDNHTFECAREIHGSMSHELVNFNMSSSISDDTGVRMQSSYIPNHETDVRIQSSYIPIDNSFKILRAGHHQGDRNIFDGRYCGVQCCAMALAIILRSSILPISDWTPDVVTQSMLAAHRFYAMVLYLQYVFENPELLERAQDIFCYDLPGRYLRVQDFNIVKNSVSLFDKSFTLSYEAESPLFGSLMDHSNPKSPGEGPGKTLLDSLHQLFTYHNAGIFIAGGKSLAVISHGDKFYLFDSHSCGPVGEPTVDGKACVIQVETMLALANCCKRSAVDERLTYTIDHVDVTVSRDSLATN